MAKFVLLGDAFSEIVDREASPVEDQSLQQKGQQKEERKGKKKTIKRKEKLEVTFSKFWFVLMPEQKCLKKQLWWKERLAVMLQIPCWVDWS